MKNSCQYDRQKITGIIYLPTEERFMCKSIRQHFVKVQLIEKGYSKEKAEEIVKTMVG